MFFSSALPYQAPVPACCNFSCVANHTCVLLCVCLCVCTSKCVTRDKVININKYERNRDDITCNIKVETEIDAHSDVKQAVK